MSRESIQRIPPTAENSQTCPEQVYIRCWKHKVVHGIKQFFNEGRLLHATAESQHRFWESFAQKEVLLSRCQAKALKLLRPFSGQGPGTFLPREQPLALRPRGRFLVCRMHPGPPQCRGLWRVLLVHRTVSAIEAGMVLHQEVVCHPED